MSLAPLTARQSDVLTYVKDFIATHGYGPTLAEIGAALNMTSSSTVHKHLRILEQKGHMQRTWNRSRSMEVFGCCPYCGHDLV